MYFRSLNSDWWDSQFCTSCRSCFLFFVFHYCFFVIFPWHWGVSAHSWSDWFSDKNFRGLLRSSELCLSGNSILSYKSTHLYLTKFLIVLLNFKWLPDIFWIHLYLWCLETFSSSKLLQSLGSTFSFLFSSHHSSVHSVIQYLKKHYFTYSTLFISILEQWGESSPCQSGTAGSKICLLFRKHK